MRLVTEGLTMLKEHRAEQAVSEGAETQSAEGETPA
jgi:hypothetical protein